MKYLPAELLSPEQASRPATTSIIQAARLVKLSSVIDEFCFRFAFFTFVFMCWSLWLVSFTDEAKVGRNWATRAEEKMLP